MAKFPLVWKLESHLIVCKYLEPFRSIVCK